MKICPQCQEPTAVTSVIEIKCNGRLIHGMELCPKCRDNFLENVPLYTPQVQDVLPPKVSKNTLPPLGAKIVTQEQLNEILQGKLDPDDLPANPKEDTIEPCPSCGTTPENLSMTGQFGCPTCYDHFEDLVIEFAEKVQGGTKHVGKKPKGYTSAEDKIKELKLKLAHAKEHGKFQEAAEIVNQLQELQQ